MKRTHTCGELNENFLDKSVTLCGWVHTRRDHGGLIFIDMRDKCGITQIVFNPQDNAQLHSAAQNLRNEFVILVKGGVRKRPTGTENNKIPTGNIEVCAKEILILNKALTPPFEIEDDIEISEDLRLQYRYLDLRRSSMQKKLLLRHKLYMAMRNFLDKENFTEVETPILTKSTPEGARDYLVPSRLSAGKFYALPQSPQLFKQILMVAGLERYFQIAKCFRDEDLRADRQPEFTQLDLEMSFIDEEDIYRLIESLLHETFKAVLGIGLEIPFLRLSYNEALERFGTDKPDLRFGLELVSVNDIFEDCQFNIFKEVLKNNGIIKALNVRGPAAFSRADIDELTEMVKQEGAKGLAYFKCQDTNLESPISKFFDKETLQKLIKTMHAANGDLILAIADQPKICYQSISRLRNHLGRRLNLINDNEYKFLWVENFPLFKYNEEEARWDMEHHPFTSPKSEDVDLIEKDPQLVRANAYDLVINGVEIASGSIRIHNSDLQKRIFNKIGLSDTQAKDRFGFLLEALSYGAPPHGGIALGLDRLIAIITNSISIRDIIAFPKTQKGTCLMTDAPSNVDEKQLKELGLTIKK